MDEEHAKALQSLRERIRTVCIRDQAQWDISWKTALSDLNSTRRGLMLPDFFFQVLEVNKVLLNRSEGHLLIRQFQEPNGSIATTKFLRWMALNAPADHVNPDLLFAQLPQPYRRIQKVLDYDIFDVAWSIITTQSAKLKASNFAAESTAGSSGFGTDTGRACLQQQKNDYDIARKHLCESTQKFSIDSSFQRAVGLVSHSLLPFLVAAYNCDPLEDPASNTAPSLRMISTTPEFKILGNFPVEFSGDSQATAGTVDAEANTHVMIKKVSALQLATDNPENFNCCIAVHLVETTVISESSGQETVPDAKLSTPITRESVNVYGIGSVTVQSGSDTDTPECSCQLIAAITPAQGPIASIVLSPDSTYLAVAFVGSAIITFYRLQRDHSAEKPQPPVMLSPTFQVDLEPTKSPFLEGECEPAIHFLTTPMATCIQHHTQPRSGPSVYAFAVCHGLNVLKYLLPSASVFNSSNQQPLIVLAPVKSWEHLSKIKSSGHDMTTQFLAVGFEDGTTIVWDVLQDTEYAFLSPIRQQQSSGSAEISNVMFCHTGYVVALSTSQQHLYFFDVRERGRPSLTRVISPPSVPSSGTFRRGLPHSEATTMMMTSLAMATATADLPIALVRHSNGMIVLYDVRSAEAIGSLSTTSSTATSPPAVTSSLSPTAKHKSEHNSVEMSIAGNQHVVAVVQTISTADACIQLYSWRDILLTCFPEFVNVSQQRDEELTDSSVMGLFLSDGSAASSAAPSLSIIVPDASIDSLENIFLRMAGAPLLSPSQQGSQSKLSSVGTASSLQSPVRLPNILSGLGLPIPESVTVDQHQSSDPAAGLLMLEPLVPDDDAFFEQYCREYLDPATIADKEVKLHRKRRELLKIMSLGAL